MAGEQIDKRVETVIDRFYDLVIAAGQVTSSKAAAALSLTQPQVERLARLLEEAKLVSVGFSLSEMVISVPQKPKTRAEPKSEEDEVSSYLEKSSTLLSDVSRARGVVGFALDQVNESLRRTRDVSASAVQFRADERNSKGLFGNVSEAKKQAATARQLAGDIVVRCDELEKALSQLPSDSGAKPESAAPAGYRTLKKQQVPAK